MDTSSTTYLVSDRIASAGQWLSIGYQLFRGPYETFSVFGELWGCIYIMLKEPVEYICYWFTRILIAFFSIIISSRKSNINHRPQTFSVFNGEPKESERAWKCYIIEETFAYPKPSQAKTALAALFTTIPYVSIIGKIPQIAIDIKKERNALMLC